MPEFYFAKFPQINYGNNNLQSVNITKNVALNPNIEGRPVLFYPHEIKENMRSDVLANYYYDDSYLEWLIFLANGILDPYYDWYLNDDEFHRFLEKKYSSVEESQRRIKYYAINWPDDSKEISVTYFQDILPEALKKYYTPIFATGTKILSYKRRQEDWIVNTNQLLRFEIDLTSNTEYSNGELVLIKSGPTTVGNGEIVVANSTVVKIQHISGNTSANNTLIGLTSNAYANITNSDVLDKVISDEEFIYWEPVSFYEVERQRNEKNKNIYLIDSRYALPIVEEMRKKLKE